VRLAVIPARGGSKRIPRKNLKPFHGRPIIAYSIDAVRASGLFDHVVVSTDDAEIAEVARALGAETPFMRPAALADDHSGTNAVVCHAAQWFAAAGTPAAEVCCVYATAPFVTGDDLRAAHALLREDVDFVFAATRFAFPVQRALLRADNGLMVPMFPQWIGARSQDLPEALHDAGQFYWGRPVAFARYAVAFLAAAVAYELPSWRVQDIDTGDYWERAERLFGLARGRP
jgi:N-acylneuraminate cytidylyltransferase